MSDRSNKSLAAHKMGEVDQANLFEAPSIPEQQRMVEAIYLLPLHQLRLQS